MGRLSVGIFCKPYTFIILFISQYYFTTLVVSLTIKFPLVRNAAHRVLDEIEETKGGNVLSNINSKIINVAADNNTKELLRKRRQLFYSRINNDISEASRIRNIIMNGSTSKTRPRRDTFRRARFHDGVTKSEYKYIELGTRIRRSTN